MAQLVEQLTLNQWVAGSSPAGCTKLKWTRCLGGSGETFWVQKILLNQDLEQEKSIEHVTENTVF